MALLSESEKQDFRAIVVGAGFSEADFVLKEIEDVPTNVEMYAVTGTVIVERRSTGASRQYAAGHATAWLFTFEADLHRHVFGPA